MARIDEAVPIIAKWLRRNAVAAFALLLAVAVVCGSLRSGASFVYCEMMHSFQHEPCCAHDREGASGDEAALDVPHVECCSAGTFPVIPSAKVVNAPDALDAPPRAVMPFPRSLAVLVVALEPHGKRANRAQWLEPPIPSAYRARRMVSLT